MDTNHTIDSDLVFFQNPTILVILLVGALGGVTQRLKASSTRILEVINSQSGNENIERFYAKKSLFSSLLRGAIPLSVAYLINITGSYVSLFLTLIILLTISSILSAMQPTVKAKKNFHLREILTIPGSNVDKFSLIQTLLFEGLTEGITTTILPIIILSYVGSIVDWG